MAVAFSGTDWQGRSDGSRATQHLGLAKVIDVDAAKCVNCHACITACPVKFCNNGAGDYIEINSDLCIGCGSCIDACTHGARHINDDFEQFMADLRSGVPMVAVVAPAVASNFPRKYLQFNGWLKSIGVAACFDVSFGAELTVRTYLEYVKAKSPKSVIAQPCPAIVSYIETYKPELLPYLAPADSPMAHTMKMVRRYMPQFRTHRIVIISPCAAKKREFDAIGIGDYNVTMARIDRYFKEQGVDLNRFKEADYDNPPAERAVLFSTPGGLKDTVERWSPAAARATRKIEGTHTVYHYLDQLMESIREGDAPLLVDCLNCDMGCNGGTGTAARKLGHDKLESIVARRAEEMRKRHAKNGATDAELQAQVEPLVDQYWEPGLYGRSYTDRRSNYAIKTPSQTELSRIYLKMRKSGDEDIKNCSACGYGTCEQMATAIHNGLNRPENCHFFQSFTIRENLLKKQDTIKEVMFNFEEVIGQVNDAGQSAKDLDVIADAIIKLSKQTHILAINAAIEAGRAGTAGAAFGVVSDAVKDLAESVRRQAAHIDPCSKNLHAAFRKATDEVRELADRVMAILEDEEAKELVGHTEKKSRETDAA